MPAASLKEAASNGGGEKVVDLRVILPAGSGGVLKLDRPARCAFPPFSEHDAGRAF